MKGLRLTARGEAVRDYLEGLACLAAIGIAVASFYSIATLIG
jgi:hypothetical protein